MKQSGEICTTAERIKTESECRTAAEELNLSWSKSFNNPTGNPGCTLSNAVYFNEFVGAAGSDPGFAEICTIAGGFYALFLQEHRGLKSPKIMNKLRTITASELLAQC